MTLSRRYIIALAFLVAASPVLAQSPPVGWKITMNITTDSGDAAHRSSMAMRRYVTDGKIRMEIVQVSNMAGADGAEGSYQIISAADSTMIMVTPAQHMAMVMPMVGGFGGRVTPKFETHVTKSQMEDLGAGGSILGHATHHVRVTSEGTIDLTLNGATCTGSNNSVSELWFASDVDMRRATESLVATTNAALGTDIGIPERSATAVTLPSGTPLRTISKATKLNAQGRPITVTTTMEYVELAEGPLDPSVFQVPPDFRVMDMRKMMSKLPSGMADSALRAGTEKGASATSKAMCQAIGSP